MIHAAVILFTAFALDLLLGDPQFSFHPIRLMGSCVGWSERLFLRLGWSGLVGGTLLVFVTVSLLVGIYATARLVLTSLQPWLATLLDVYLAYSCLALTDLLKHAKPVAGALNRGEVTQARRALQKIVGRDTSNLNPEGVARGAVESVAENFVDGVLSPMFWYTVGSVLGHLFGSPAHTVAGISGMLTFKTISTLDSMVGYRHEPYLFFGRPAARLDDLANFIPARLSLPILYIGALISGENARGGLRVSLRDRLKHLSPNAGHSESFVAGALGIRLGGPTIYKEATVDKPWLGDGDESAGPEHIQRCCRLISRSSWLAVLLMVVVLLLSPVVLT
ncbi:MAG: cobalamin biosynthesis protein CobD [Deltaproteobacteria bacterium]|nr:MAG: cobalamin biosynthesis protein CobD [Deltaproteobacteria bacterium]